MPRPVRPMSMSALLVLVACTTSACEAENNSLYKQTAYLKPSNTGFDDQFSVGLDWFDDDLVVGAPFEESAAVGVNGDQEDDSAPESGAAYVFRRSGSDGSSDRRWSQKAYLKASNTDAGDQFGYSVAIVGDVIAVGAFAEDSAATGINGDQADNSARESGAVYVFRRTENVWQQEAYIKAPNAAANHRFGYSVSLWGDTLAVAAPGEDRTGTGINPDQTSCCSVDAGAVYIYRRVGETWRQEAYIKPPQPDGGQFFGSSVSLAQDALAVGAPVVGTSVYVFRRNGSTWEQDARIEAPDEDPFPHAFGQSVKIWAGDVLLVGAPLTDDGGAAYVFHRTDSGWQQDARLTGANTENYDSFGYSVAISGRLLAIGASRESSAARKVDGNDQDDTAPASGAVYVFWREDSTWEQVAYLKAFNTDVLDEFGASVAISNGSIAVGAQRESSDAKGINGDETDDSNRYSGAVYIFDERL